MNFVSITFDSESEDYSFQLFETEEAAKEDFLNIIVKPLVAYHCECDGDDTNLEALQNYVMEQGKVFDWIHRDKGYGLFYWIQKIENNTFTFNFGRDKFLNTFKTLDEIEEELGSNKD